jgi:predicted enzyme related to lactoylglutathione lyase
VTEDEYALVLDSNGTRVRVQKVRDLAPVPRTTLGWNVRDIEATVRALEAAGVAMERFPFLDQNEDGITDFPSGSRVAWFRDPDGNILSVAQLPR